ncbi:MAG: hypothetical protein IIT98_02060 [Kiritimatiellae bacterium]|nr:hypothetical protein [Kiritimatiellia bacterium]
MNPAQQAILGARVFRVRELNAQIARLKEENSDLREKVALFESHFALAVLAARDFASADGAYYVVDGWNLVLGAHRLAASSAELVAKTRAFLDVHAGAFAWIVFDGGRAASDLDGRMRISYTGGTGSQRADRLILDFVRMAGLSGESGRICVVTRDRKLASEAVRLGASASGELPVA